MEDLVANDRVYSRLEELQRRREDIISIRAAAHAKLTAKSSQGELGAGDVPSSNERGDVSMGDMSGPRPGKVASSVTYSSTCSRRGGRSDSSGRVTVVVSRRKTVECDSMSEPKKVDECVEPAVCHKAELMRESAMCLRIVKLARGQRTTSSGTSRRSVIGPWEWMSWVTQIPQTHRRMMCEVAYVPIGMSSIKDPAVYQGRSCDRVSFCMTLWEFHFKKTSSFLICSASVKSHAVDTWTG